nr:inositol monophosphatase [Parvularcula dongshanensis]
MCAAVRQAGEAVRQRFEAGNTKAWEKDDDTPVSEADYESNDILKAALLDDEDYGWLSEESAEDEDRLSASRTWIVDPIDGTHAFLKGQPHFAVCVALVEDGRAVSAAIFNPATDEFFEAIRGGGARCNGEALCASSAEELDGCRVLGSKAMFEHPGWPEPWPVMRLAYRNSTSYRLALVAAGRYDATIALVRKADWDVAPGALIACEAGAVATDHKGDPFVFAKPHPVQRALVCAAPRLYPRIIERLGHLPDDLRQVAL